MRNPKSIVMAWLDNPNPYHTLTKCRIILYVKNWVKIQQTAIKFQQNLPSWNRSKENQIHFKSFTSEYNALLKFCFKVDGLVNLCKTWIFQKRNAWESCFWKCTKLTFFWSENGWKVTFWKQISVRGLIFCRKKTYEQNLTRCQNIVSKSDAVYVF